jgi:mitogen-activated protein kinase kinase kinase
MGTADPDAGDFQGWFVLFGLAMFLWMFLQIGQSAKPAIPSDISSEAQDFLTKTFDLNHSARPSAGELLQHPWVAVKKHAGFSSKNAAPKSIPTIEISA